MAYMLTHSILAIPLLLLAVHTVLGARVQYSKESLEAETQQVEIGSQGEFLDLTHVHDKEDLQSHRGSMSVDIIDSNLLSAQLRTEALETDPSEYASYLRKIGVSLKTATHITDVGDMKMGIYDLIRTYMKTAVNGDYLDYVLNKETKKLKNAERLINLPHSHTVASLLEAPFVCAQEGQECICSGTIYYGRSENTQMQDIVDIDNETVGSGKVTTLRELKEASFLTLDTSTSMHPITCAVSTFGNDPLPNFDKQCICDPKPAVVDTVNDVRLVNMLRTTAEQLAGNPQFDAYRKHVFASDQIILDYDNFYLPSITAIKFDTACKVDASTITQSSCPTGPNNHKVLDGWLKSTPLEWLQDDMLNVYKNAKPFAIGQAGKNVETAKPEAQAGLEPLEFGNLQPFRCTEPPHNSLWIPGKAKGKHDFVKARLYDLVILAVRNRVLYTFAKMPFNLVKSYFHAIQRDGVSEERLRVSHNALVAAGEGRFEYFEEVLSAACSALKSGSDPQTQATRLASYIESINNGADESKPALVLLQEVASNVFPKITVPKNYQFISPTDVGLPQGKLTTDNSAIFISNSFLKQIFGASGPTLKPSQIYMAGTEVERRLLVKYEDSANLLILGSVHFSSQKPAHELMTMELGKFAEEEVLREMLAFGGSGKKMAIFGGDVNFDPRDAEDGYKVLQKKIWTNSGQKLKLIRLTSPKGKVSYAKMLSPLQSQVAKIDKSDQNAIDHVFAVIPTGWTITQKDAEDKWLEAAFQTVLQREAYADSTPDLGPSDAGSPYVSDLTTKISGFMDKGTTFLPIPFSTAQADALKEKAFVLSSDHLPVTVSLNVNIA